ncbi:MAG: DUF4249 family protein [Bacteroidales bacterium]|nr:DUF4249 family protein [Bacteroidales bacterium]
MRNYIVIVLSAIVLTGCQEVYVPEIEDPEPVIMIEGMFTSLPENHLVKITYTRSFNERPYYDYVDNARVEIEDDLGTIIPFDYYGVGIYITDTNHIYQAEIGRTYVLRIVTPEGDVFESTPQTVIESPELSKLTCRYDQETILTENVNGDVYEIKMGGIDIFCETSGILPFHNYYFYRWDAYIQNVTVVTDPMGMSYFYFYRHNRISRKYRDVIKTGNADDYADYNIRNREMVFITTEDMSNYVQPFPDTMYVLLDSRFEGLLFRLEQLSISDDAYSFWREAELQLEAEGRLFDPVASQLKGNIKCVSDSTKNTIGVFSASHASLKYAYFYIDYRNLTTSIDIDSFPQLYLDTCHWGMPDDWIRVPY